MPPASPRPRSPRRHVSSCSATQRPELACSVGPLGRAIARPGADQPGPGATYTPGHVPPLESDDRHDRIRGDGRGHDRRAAARSARGAGAGRRQPSSGGTTRRACSDLRDPDRRRQRRGDRRGRRDPARDQAPDAGPGGPRDRPARARRSAGPVGHRRRDDHRHRGLSRPSPDRPEHAQHAGPAGPRHDRLVRHTRDHDRAARPGPGPR